MTPPSMKAITTVRGLEDFLAEYKLGLNVQFRSGHWEAKLFRKGRVLERIFEGEAASLEGALATALSRAYLDLDKR